MKKITIILIIMFSFFSKVSANYSQLAYEFHFQNIEGGVIKLSDYKNKIIGMFKVISYDRSIHSSCMIYQTLIQVKNNIRTRVSAVCQPSYENYYYYDFLTLTYLEFHLHQK